MCGSQRKKTGKADTGRLFNPVIIVLRFSNSIPQILRNCIEIDSSFCGIGIWPVLNGRSENLGYPSRLISVQNTNPYTMWMRMPIGAVKSFQRTNQTLGNIPCTVRFLRKGLAFYPISQYLIWCSARELKPWKFCRGLKWVRLWLIMPSIFKVNYISCATAYQPFSNTCVYHECDRAPKPDGWEY